MADEEKLKLGKGAAFVKSRLKHLRQSDEIWEAAFRELPQPMQPSPHHLGIVISQHDGSLLADLIVHEL